MQFIDQKTALSEHDHHNDNTRPFLADTSRQKWSFITRRVCPSDATSLTTKITPSPGDLVLAKIGQIAQHTKIQLRSGRRSQLYAGDRVVVAYGNRYASDQFEAEVPNDLSTCHFVAAGGIAAAMISKLQSLKVPTALEPVGLLTDVHSEILNLSRYRIRDSNSARSSVVPCIAVLGASMNAGKTTATANLVRGLSLAGKRIAAIKVTGTGAGNDLWAYEDAGAALTLDFTDAGFASTYKLTANVIEGCLNRLVLHAAHQPGIDAIIVEVADGLLHSETADLAQSSAFREHIQAVLFASGDAMGAVAGTQWLEQRGIEVIGITGALTASELAMAEVESATGLRAFSKEALASASIQSIFRVAM